MTIRRDWPEIAIWIYGGLVLIDWIGIATLRMVFVVPFLAALGVLIARLICRARGFARPGGGDHG